MQKLLTEERPDILCLQETKCPNDNFPLADFRDYVLPERAQGHHWSEWAEACVNGGRPGANFDYSGPLTEAVLLGSVAVRFPGQDLTWDGPNLAFTNVPAANAHLRRTYRRGWEVAGL